MVDNGAVVDAFTSSVPGSDEYDTVGNSLKQHFHLEDNKNVNFG